MKHLTAVAVAMMLTFTVTAQINKPQEIPYQGTIADTGGVPFEGTFDFIFEIEDETGGSLYNSGTVPADVHIGAYAVVLGASPMPPIPETIWKSNDSLFLCISFDDGVNGMQALEPCLPIYPVPWAIRSCFADVYCGDTLRTIVVIVDTIYSKKVRIDTIISKVVKVDTLTSKVIISDTIISKIIKADVVCAKDTIKVDDGTGSKTTLTPGKIETDDGLGQTTVEGDKVTTGTVKGDVVCAADTVKVDGGGGKKATVTEGKMEVTDGSGTTTTEGGKVEISDGIGTTTVEGGKVTSDTLVTKVICAEEIKVEDPSVFGLRTTIKPGEVTTSDDLGNSSSQFPGGESHSDGLRTNDVGPGGSTITDGLNTTEVNHRPDGKTEITNTHAGPPPSQAGVIIDGENGEVCINGKLKTGSITNTGDLEVCGDLTVKGFITDSTGALKFKLNPATGELEFSGLDTTKLLRALESGYFFEDQTGLFRFFYDLLRAKLEVENQSNGEKTGLEIDGTSRSVDVLPGTSLGFDPSIPSTVDVRVERLGDGLSERITSGSASSEVRIELNALHLSSAPVPLDLGMGLDIPLQLGIISMSNGVNNVGIYFDPQNNQIGTPGNFFKGGGSFKIDHPLDPENKYLYHSFVESPDMMNIYNGNVVTDDGGMAVVQMPDYFEALNRDFRYQLTVMGEFAQAVVADKISGGKFVIKTDKPNVEVSWQVTGVRQDTFAEENRIPVEANKVGDERGSLIYQPKGVVSR